MTTLMFRKTILETITHNGQIWFTSTELAKALQYSSVKSVTNLYNQNRDEFTEGMSLVIDSVTNGINNSLRKIGLRIFFKHVAVDGKWLYVYADHIRFLTQKRHRVNSVRVQGYTANGGRVDVVA